MPSKPLSECEIQAILSYLPSKRDKALFTLAVKTGFRISEILSLTIMDVIGDTVTVRRCNMKGKTKSRCVPLHKTAKQAIKDYLDEIQEPWGACNLTNKLFSISRQHVHRIIRAACEKARVKGKVSSHSCRKTFAMSVYTRSNKDLKATQLALGHKSIASTGHYLCVEKEVIDKLILSS